MFFNKVCLVSVSGNSITFSNLVISNSIGPFIEITDPDAQLLIENFAVTSVSNCPILITTGNSLAYASFENISFVNSYNISMNGGEYIAFANGLAVQDFYSFNSTFDQFFTLSPVSNTQFRNFYFA